MIVTLRAFVNKKFRRCNLSKKSDEPKATKSNESDERIKCSNIELAFKILAYLKEHTDEEHRLTQIKIMEALKVPSKSGALLPTSARTYQATIQKMMKAVNPAEYNGNNLDDYLIRDRNLHNEIKQHNNPKKPSKANNDSKDSDDEFEKKKADAITDLYYGHVFSHDELDDLIENVYISKTISSDRKLSLITKLKKLSSSNYKTRFLNDDDELRANIHVIQENQYISHDELSKNIDSINEGINIKAKISFHLNYYTADKKLKKIEAKKNEENIVKEYVVSPYEIVIYNGKYYLLANTEPYDNISIYRVDLISDISIKYNKNEKGVLKIDKRRERNNFNKDLNSLKDFMNQHLYMFYDQPEEIHIHIKNDRYTLLHDSFGDSYSRWHKINDDIDLVKIRCSPNALIKWAMQNSDIVEIETIELRKKIRAELEAALKKYSTDKCSK